VIRSMTAFARAESSAQWGTAYWELRSVNNRFLDVAARLPEDLRAIEGEVRERVRSRVRRGKVDCTLKLVPSVEAEGAFALDMELAKRLAEASREIDKLLHDPARVNAMDILRWPGVAQTRLPDPDMLGGAVLELLDRALDDLLATREREGRQIHTLIEQRCAEVDAIVARVRERLPEIVVAFRERLAARLAEVRESLDEERLEQEMVIVAQRIDVSEELDRLEAHVAEVRRVLDQDKPAGRRLDFLMQELNREANTLGSKSVDTETTRASVDLKVLIEQMREQIQNVE